ncbi:MAG: DUF2339 domain-containing protein [Gemmatimonadales bacterium]
MSLEERMDRLEHRLAVLETLVRQLAAPRGIPVGSAPVLDEVNAGPMPPRPAMAAPAPKMPPPRPPAPAVVKGILPLTSEQWIGQRVFLGIGVAALLAAAGYLLKLSFERNWITPVMRCLGGVGAGVVVGAIGWRLHSRYRTYGAALIGAGAGIIYLSVWAAAKLYGVVPSAPGIVGLALISVALAMIAYAINVEALGTAAALGAFMAPVLLGESRANANLLLLYLASMAVGLGLVAARRRWRLTMLVVAASYFGVGIAGAAERAIPWAVLVYGVGGGTAGLFIGMRERWWETRLLTFSGGWWLLAAANDRLATHWVTLVAAVILAAPVWWHGLRSPRVLPIHMRPLEPLPATGTAEPLGWSAGEAFYFFVTPFLLAWALHASAPGRFDATPGLVALVVAIPYLLAGYLRPLAPFAAVGAAAAGIAVSQHWEGAQQVYVLLGLALVWATLDHRLNRLDGRWYGLLTLAAALQYLFDQAARTREASDAAFTGPWALALWAAIAAATAFASGGWRTVPEGREETRVVKAGLWAVAGAMTLFGVTGEIRRYFEVRSLTTESASLASGLAVSAWWLVFASALVVAGFRLSLKPARVAGLAAAGMAVLKVVFFDLSSLDALYRVGSVFILALVALSLAYLYYRSDRSARTP